MRTHQPENATHEILSRVAAARDVEPTELPPLQETIDVDALNALLDDRFSGTCSFTYAGCDITLSGEGSIRVRRRCGDVTDRSAGATRQRSID